MDNPELIWVEVELQESSNSTAFYCGQINILELENVYQGNYKLPFLKLINVFWYEYPDDEDEKLGKGRKLNHFGNGKFSQHQGEVYIKTERIYFLSRLKHGPKHLDEDK